MLHYLQFTKEKASCILVTLLLICHIEAFAQYEKCGVDLTRRHSYDNHSKRLDNKEQIIQNWIKNQQNEVGFRTVVTIPVVVHVIWNSAAEDIPEAQILSQIEVLNQDFGAENIELPNVPAVFKDRIADVDFEFCLAKLDPNGQPTNGITRTFTINSTGIGGASAIHYNSMGGHDAWDTKHYLNIWVAKFAGGIGGIGSFPGEDPPAEDGIEIDYRQFGTINTPPPYHLGRTTTHEVGHYFNLEHVWGPAFNSCCDEDDFVTDTPNSCESYLSQCPVHPIASCSEADMFMNFMNYTDDACMAMFTEGQKTRMLAALNLFRPELLDAQGCLSVATNEPQPKARLVIYQNPSDGFVSFEIKETGVEKWTARLFNAIGREVYKDAIASNSIIYVVFQTLPPGIYWLFIENGKESITEKIIVK